ncbi:hypothetical protein [uncultured Aquimarina sp.]|uniref:hypothetical protein n=1 Tax=uncultured Aquimarina sp. TaxID=575652 RepID=UPI00263789CD|nr:hypothetical protein [uncultured Aquimarina sp.]
MGILQKFKKVLLTVIVMIFFIYSITGYAQGITSPDARGFEPIDVNGVVNLLSGDMSYSIPVLSIGGYPVSLSYHSGVTTDLDASWVGLGWYLTPGAINRSVQGIPDDWKSGVGINFTSYHTEQEYHSIGVSYGGFDGIVSSGTEFSWGEGKGLTVTMWDRFFDKAYVRDSRGRGDQVKTGYGINGGYSQNITKSTSVGLGASYNTHTGDTSYNINVGGKTDTGAAWSVGASFNDNGYTIGGSYAGYGGSYGQSSDSFSQGDYSIDTQSDSFGASAVLGVGVLGVAYTKKKVDIHLRKGQENREWGVLYGWDYNNLANIDIIADEQGSLNDYQNRQFGYDAYSTEIPQAEETFLADYSKLIEKPNFTFAGYDNYGVSAQGISGKITPRILDNISIFSKGVKTQNANGQDIHAFWHHGNVSDASQRHFGQSHNSVNTLNFYFDGHFSSKELVEPSTILGSGNNLSDHVTQGGLNLSNSYTDDNVSGRAKSPNFIETFTNNQITSNYATNVRGLIIPSNLNNTDRENDIHFSPNGIGAYKITSTDGKTYHYSLPVYHFERIQRNLIETSDAANVKENRQYTPFATHWLLTAVTGPDYIDFNNNNRVDEEDYGFWIEFEYGKWSDGFVWRSPYEDGVMDYYTNLKGEVETKDKGHYQFGRKQLYYLDKIKSKEHTAIFVKDIRYDAVGKNLGFWFNSNVTSSGYLSTTGENSGMNHTSNIHVRERSVNYAREYSLKLDKIIVLKTEDANYLVKNGSGSLGSGLSNYTRDSWHSPQWESPYFAEAYGSSYSYRIHNESLVFDVNDLSNTFISENALNVIDFSYNYDLAPNSPSSKGLPAGLTNVSHPYGKLTLNEIRMNGKGNSEIMPPYKFEYYLETMENLSLDGAHGNNTVPEFVDYKNSVIDNWGFLKGEEAGIPKIKAWNLKEITSPIGSTVEFDYEEDDYWTEAFSRRYWKEGLKFTFYNTNNLYCDQNGEIEIKIEKDNTLLGNNDFDFRDYFYSNEKFFIDVWYSKMRNYPGNGYRRAAIDILKQKAQILELSSDEMRIKVTARIRNCADGWEGVNNIFNTPIVKNDIEYSLGQNKNRYELAWVDENIANNDNAHSIIYNLLASKVPEDETGGGLRVKEIKVSDGNTSYRTQYDYSNPYEINNNNQPRSSGITSFAPVKGLKYVPYRSELTPPGVMYEYVTVKSTAEDGSYYTKNRYQHHVLKPVFNIFNPEITMETNEAQSPQEDKLFWAKVNEQDITNGKAKTVDIHVNTAILGQLKSMEVYNSKNHLMYKVSNEFTNGTNLGNEPDKGHIKESFNSMKTIFTTNSNGTAVLNSKKLLSVSSRTEYNNMLKKTVLIGGNNKFETEYSNPDPWLGSFRTSKTTQADGSSIYSERVPAYAKYPEMGSKVDNPSNKNMLTQEAMSITSWSYSGGASGGWKTLNANITTWNNSWNYRDYKGNEEQLNDVWRKHKSFVWKDDINVANGSYVTNVNKNNNYFDWTTGTPTNEKWNNVSETTRYTHWSSPIENKDINGNYVSSKMAENQTKVVASGNASYTELYASSAEYNIDGEYLDQDIQGANLRDESDAHTGQFSLRIGAGDKGFKTRMRSGEYAKDNYKISVWANSLRAATMMRLNINGKSIAFNGEIVQAGRWYQFNHYEFLDGSENTLYLTLSDRYKGIQINIDDFRIHPVYASINTYVYDQNTDELTYVLDANNMATKYVYDNAGRLCRLFKEVEADLPETDGGFKLINQYKYNYKNGASNDCSCCDDNKVKQVKTISK